MRYQSYAGAVDPLQLADALGKLPGIKLDKVGDVTGGPASLQALVSNQIDISSSAFYGAVLLLAAAVWGLFCMSCTVVALSQPAVGQAFPAALAGRALSAYNLVIFVGVFLLMVYLVFAMTLYLLPPQVQTGALL